MGFKLKMLSYPNWKSMGMPFNPRLIFRLTTLALLFISMFGPWFYDSHPATEAMCSAPLIWLGDGACACLVSLMTGFSVSVGYDRSTIWLYLPPMLPFLSTLLLFLSRENPALRSIHWIVIGLVIIYSLFFFIGMWFSHHELILWGAGLYGLVGLCALVTEIWITRLTHRRVTVMDWSY